jgi:hypothetical protein
MFALIGSLVHSSGPFLFVYKTCARRPPSIVLKRMAAACGAWAVAPDPPIAPRSCATVAPAAADLLRRKRPKINCRPALNWIRAIN